MAVTRLIVFFNIIHPSSVHGSCHPIPFHAILIVPCFIIDCQPSRWYVKGDHSMEFEYKNPSLWRDLAEKDRDALFAYGERYKAFLDAGKTERECAAEMTRQAHAHGFIDLADVLAAGKNAKKEAGTDRLQPQNKNRQSSFLFGERPLGTGMHPRRAPRYPTTRSLASALGPANSPCSRPITTPASKISVDRWTCQPLALRPPPSRPDAQSIMRIGLRSWAMCQDHVISPPPLNASGMPKPSLRVL